MTKFMYRTTLNVTLQVDENPDLSPQEIAEMFAEMVAGMKLSETEAARKVAVKGINLEFIAEDVPLSCVDFTIVTEAVDLEETADG